MSGWAFVWLFENHSNKVVEKVSREFNTFSGVTSDTKVVLQRQISSFNRSYIKMLESKGPNMDPCGTPNKFFPKN